MSLLHYYDFSPGNTIQHWLSEQAATGDVTYRASHLSPLLLLIQQRYRYKSAEFITISAAFNARPLQDVGAPIGRMSQATYRFRFTSASFSNFFTFHYARDAGIMHARTIRAMVATAIVMRRYGGQHISAHGRTQVRA